MATASFVDYYDLLQISPGAEQETIARVYRLLAARYHPDNRESGDVEKFLLLKQAYETLSDPARRASYDAAYQLVNQEPIPIFDSEDFMHGIDGERNRRMGILFLLYQRRRSNPDHPGVSLLELESMMSFPREHLLFPIWYLKEKGFLRLDDSSNYMVTAEGVDHVEANLASHKALYKLLEAAESGRTRSGDEGRPDMAG